MSYRRLKRRAADAGHVLPYSTAASMLGRDRLPRAELVAAFVAACGLRGEEAEAWPDARSRIACAAAPNRSVPVPGPVPVPAPGPRRGPRARRWVTAGAAALLAALLGGTAALGVPSTEEVQETRTPSVAGVLGE
ncbi:hypothetical protein C4J65_24655 [Streptomyces sp. CB09001]|uniref:hypothetical protein n=1 Tax=Streptomyces sp. CB09001 TaxID=2083284 RepID=UPI000E213BEF|nr:hypothetical protein [Streptomyces sp. CB09001]AXL91137.1 hypothetical protein C4J65_24655 [Streptomyces sp. CB09001]